MGWSQAGWGALIMLGLEKIGHLITGFISRKRKQPGISKATPRLLELEGRLVPASAVFTNVANVPLLTINLACFNRHRRLFQAEQLEFHHQLL